VAGAIVAVIGFVAWSYVVREHAMDVMESHQPLFPTKESAD
jgi:hypothetical protein